MNKIFLIGLIAVSFCNCRTSKPVIKNAPAEAIAAPEIVVKKNPGLELNGTWELQSLWGIDNKWLTAPYIDIDFNNKAFNGNVGCNTLSGKFTTNENYIAFDKEITSTKMACPGNVEKPFLSILLKINKFVVNNSELELSLDDIVLMKFKQR